MEQIKLGQPINGEAHRDAIHIAICPVVADEKLAPGQDIGFVDSVNLDRVGFSNNPVGIVDPFLKQMVFPGQRIYMLLYPNTITSLRHEWTHPAFNDDAPRDNPAQTEISMARAWLADFGQDFNLTCDELIEVVADCRKNGGYHRLGFDTPDSAWANRREFWRRYEIVTGERIEDYEDGLPFSCSC